MIFILFHLLLDECILQITYPGSDNDSLVTHTDKWKEFQVLLIKRNTKKHFGDWSSINCECDWDNSFFSHLKHYCTPN